MKPLVLTLENFGPYRHEQIFFDHFEAFPLFLITGKTGSGKTTLFDGMCFALYGEATGETRQAKDMRADFASSSEKTQVSLVFEHLNKRYEIVREPMQFLKKKNGQGVTKKEAKVTLKTYENQEIIDEISGNQPVKLKIEELLQLTVQQFRQIILLPQGEFRKFLNASSNDKEKVLRRLFGTQIYSQMGLKIKEQKSQEEKRLAKAEEKLAVLFEQAKITSAAHETLKDLSATDEKIDWLQKINQTIKSEEEALLEAYKKSYKQFVSAQEQLQAALQLQEKFDQKQRLIEEQQVLNIQTKEIESKEKELENVRLLEQLQPVIDQWQQVKVEHQEIVEKLQVLADEKQATQGRLTKTQKSLAVLYEQEAEITTKQNQLQKIEQFLPFITEQKELRQQIVEKEHQLCIETKKSLTLKEALDAKETEKLAQQQMLAKESDLLKLSHVLEVSLNQLTNYQKNYEELASQEVDLQTKVTNYQQVVLEKTKMAEQLKEAEHVYKKAKSEAARQQIALLRLDLLPDTPCPVCGSLEHAYEAEDVAYSQTQIASAQTDLSEAEEKLTTCRHQVFLTDTKLEQLKHEMDALQATIKQEQTQLMAALVLEKITPKSASLDTINVMLEQHVAQQTEQLADVSGQLKELEQLKKEQPQQEELFNELQARYGEQEKINQASKEALVRLDSQKKQLEKHLPKDSQEVDYTKLAQQLATAIKEWQQQIQEVTEALKEHQNALDIVQIQQKEQTRQQEKLSLKLEQLNQRLIPQLETLGLVLDERLSIEVSVQVAAKEQLEETITHYFDQKKRLQALLEDLEQTLENQKVPDLIQLEEQMQAYQKQAEALKEQHIVLNQTQTDNANLITQITNLYQTLKEEWENLADLTQLANVANGDGQYKLGFERFVLQVYFAETLKIANEKLRQLSNQRYLFELDDTQGSYRKNTGLELNIYDDNIGAMRSVNTLSGGESFIAALSLALALGEVVQAQAGGVRIDAMFIDEGFGSLDEDSLEMAIEALESVESKGRVIGIISHVRELKQRIPQQIQVVSEGTGESHIQYQGI